MSSVVERFLRYVKIDTQSDPDSSTCPSTAKQMDLARVLFQELKDLGVEGVHLDENGYVMASLPSNQLKEIPGIGFIAHMDTSPDMSGAGVKPQLVENYAGIDIVLNAEKNIILSPTDFPELKRYIGQTLIVTDGTTLLGADDKAGIAEIIAAVEILKKHPEIPHGSIKVGFTPDVLTILIKNGLEPIWRIPWMGQRLASFSTKILTPPALQFTSRDVESILARRRIRWFTPL